MRMTRQQHIPDPLLFLFQKSLQLLFLITTDDTPFLAPKVLPAILPFSLLWPDQIAYR